MKKVVKNVMDADILNVNMSIYTRTGDDGTTTTFGGIRKSKSDPLFYAIGAIDELTSFIGLATTKIKSKKDKQFLVSIQKDLYEIMANLSGAKVSLDFLNKKVTDFENRIDKLDKKLSKLNKFILPGETELSSWFHILRTVCRRAERNVVKLSDNNMIKYLNRLSDLLFVLARSYGKNKEIIL